MRLLHLRLDESFRSLPAGFRVTFLAERDRQSCFEFAPYCLAGLNGSGKSNLLEALAAIFYHIEVTHLTYRPEGFIADEENPHGFDARHGDPDAYELEYYCQDDELPFILDVSFYDDRPVVHIKLSKEAGQPPVMQWLNRADFEEDKPLVLTSLEAKRYLPRYVLGYSSGHNEVLSLPFQKMRFIHFDEYRHYLRLSLPYQKPEGRLLLMDQSYSQVILLCHFLFPSAPVQKVFRERVKLWGIRRFRFIIRRAERVKIPLRDLEENAETGEVELTSRLTGKYDKEGKQDTRLIDKLIKCATCHFEDYRYADDEGSHDLYLDYVVDDELRRAFRYHFGAGAQDAAKGDSEDRASAKSALNLFDALHVLLTLNGFQASDEVKKELYHSDSLYSPETLPTPASHDRIFRIKDFEILKEGVTEPLYGKALSDGEHQLIHTIGLCLLFRHEPALFLLDEPETHLNPGWRAEYISTLRAALKEKTGTSKTMREVLITSHSPFIISDCQQENVLIFKKDGNNEVICERPDFQTFGASANAITIKVFEQTGTIGDHAMEVLDGYGDRLEQGEDPDKLISEADNALGDSVEKVLFINRALNRKEGK